MKLLVVEDDLTIAEPLLDGLRHHGFDVHHVARGTETLDAIEADAFDVVLLDLGLPDIDGLDVCRKIRSIASTPVIMLTARSEEVDRVVGLELGADDYVVKPFGLRELVARIRAVRRRFDATMPNGNDRSNEREIRGNDEAAGPDAGGQGADTSLCFGALEINQRTHRVYIGGVELALTPKEYGVLVVLAADPGAVVTRSSLIDQVWDEHWYGPTKTLDVHVAQLRRKLGSPRWIETVRSVGYRLHNPDDESPSPFEEDSTRACSRTSGACALPRNNVYRQEN